MRWVWTAARRDSARAVLGARASGLGRGLRVEKVGLIGVSNIEEVGFIGVSNIEEVGLIQKSMGMARASGLWVGGNRVVGRGSWVVGSG
jgi:hypothetical protein